MTTTKKGENLERWDNERSKLYSCDFCGSQFSTPEEAAMCEETHEKDIEISSMVYLPGCYKGMPCEIRLENKERTKLAIYKFIDVIER